MKDVARRAGVSVTTVSATLSGAAIVSPKLRAKVTHAINELGYQPNSMARGLKSGRTTQIGLIVPDISNPFFSSFVEFIQRFAVQQGHTVIFGMSDNSVEQERALIKLMRSNQIAGLIISPAGGAQAYETFAQDCGSMPVVAFNNVHDGFGMDAVSLDNSDAAIAIVSHILSLGHTRVATIAGPQEQAPAKARMDGFLKALRSANIVPEPAYLEHGDFLEEAAFQAGQRLLALKDRPTAVFVANNQMLIGFMRAAADVGVSVPEEVSVASFDDFSWSTAFRPALTVIRQPITEMADRCVALLLARLDTPDSPVVQEVFAPQLVLRASCQPPRVDVSGT